MLRKLGLPILAIGAVLFAFSTSAAFARDHGGGGHGSGGHGSSRGGGFSGGGEHFGNRGFSGGNYGNHFGGQRFSGGREFNGGARFYGGDRGYDRSYSGRAWGGYDRNYRGGGLYFGFGAPYVYGPNYYYPGGCDPAGYYDQWGNWQPYPGCYVDPYYP